eukprot:TRINITY_DN7708_c0_g1_i1.p1 TRINITY_DN7708_c0_g1~~TRINITY_DN7708_c0_g1_i1.p1  ORF type:complete len:375 (-),score=33.50 TRINITY_DN7708_c0_g1_i1:12-1136(-)
MLLLDRAVVQHFSADASLCMRRSLVLVGVFAVLCTVILIAQQAVQPTAPDDILPRTMAQPLPEIYNGSARSGQQVGTCLSYVTIQPDRQGIGHAHFNRDSALQVAQYAAKLGARVCFAFSDPGTRHLEIANATWDRALGFGSGFVHEADLRLRRIHVPIGGLTVPTTLVAQYIAEHFESQRLYILKPHQDSVDHCGTAGIWADQYHSHAGRDRLRLILSAKASGCNATIAVHVRRYDLGGTAVTSTNYFSRAVATAQRLLSAEGYRSCVLVFSRAEKASQRKNLETELSRGLPGASIFLDTDSVITFHSLANSDVLVMSRSKFSFLAALMQHGVKITLPTPYRTCGLQWIHASEKLPSPFSETSFREAWRSARP